MRGSVDAEVEAVDRAGLSGGFVNVDHDGVHLDVALGDDEAGGHGIVEKVFQDAVLFHADDRIVRAGHADVGDVGGPGGQHAEISRWDVRVRANHSGYLAIQVPAHGDFFRCGLGVHVDEDYFHLGRDVRELARGHAKRVLNRRHVGAALKIQHGVAHAILCGSDVQAFAWRAFGKIRGPQQPRLRGKVLDDFPSLPDVVPAGQDIGPGGEKILRDPRRDAEAWRGVFAIDDAEIDLALREDIREPVVNDLAAGRADDVADE